MKLLLCSIWHRRLYLAAVILVTPLSEKIRMKFQGKVFNWNDDKGYGFVEPNGGGERAFVHIKEFKLRSRRPVNGEVIIYKRVQENSNRFKATHITFARDVRASNSRGKTKVSSKFATTFTVFFCLGLLASFALGKLPLIVILFYFVMSLFTFIAYAIDKSAAKNGRWRTKESTLHFFSIIGGWLGGYVAQSKLRHKSSKVAFKRAYWMTVFINVFGLAWLHTEKGMYFLDLSVAALSNG